MLSIKIFDKFLVLNQVTIDMPQANLLAMVCICMAVKMQETVMLAFDQAAILSHE
jgi:hypothetical protein